MRLLTPIFIFLVSFLGYSSDVLWNVRLEGQSIYDGNLVVEDGDFSQLGTGSFVDVGQKTFGYIRLGMGEVPNGGYPTGKVSYKLRLIITPYSDAGLIQPSMTTYLEATYSGAGHELVVDAEDFRLLGVHKFLVDVDGVSRSLNGGSYNSVTSGLPSYMYLEAGFSAERYYELSTSQVPLAFHNYISYDAAGVATTTYNQGSTAAGSADEIEISWNYVDGAESYDLEWTWVDNYNATSLSSSPLGQGVVALTELDFQHNSTRIRTGNQSYRIPQVFAKGYLVYRVRGVGRWLSDLSKDKYGLWSGNTDDKDVVSDWVVSGPGVNVITIDLEHEGLKNWQYDATYAEGGKKKEIAQYFDGSLRPRQIVTRMNSDNHSVVGETVYDNEGRGVIQILPVPQVNPGIQYYDHLNKNAVGVPYSYEDFDLEDESTSTCVPALAGELLNSSGASKYYSPGGHGGETDWQQYVPDAKGYPFTQVEYTPDNTGRILNQSGVGLDHQLGSDHQTIYYYLQPAQEELNRLFGYKVGYKQRYKKNMVVDANGQVSISYLDAAGKVVATALAGDKPSAGGEDPDASLPLSGLASEIDMTNHSSLTIDILGKLDANDVNTPNDNNDLLSTGRFGSEYDGLKSGTQIAVAKNNTEYTFDYKVTTSYFTAACGESGINYPFVYDVKLSVKDDCGDEKLTLTHEKVGEEELASTTTDLFESIETLNLAKGAYTVYKEITVNEESLLAYKAHYLSPGAGCIELPAAFTDAVGGCDTVTCAGCIEELGSWEDYLSQAALDLGHAIANPSNEYDAILDVYNQLHEECIESCRPLTTCDVYLESMLTDLRPQGQYGGTTPGDGLSIFNPSGHLTNAGNTVCNWRNLAPYLDENGQESLIPVSTFYNSSGILEYTPRIDNATNLITINGSLYIHAEHLFSETEFINYFQDSWSERFLTFHPEYQLYEYAYDICSHPLEIAVISGPAGVDFEVSSDVFNNMVLNQALSYTAASDLETTLDGLDFFHVNLLQYPGSTRGGLYEIDPYFHQTYADAHSWITTHNFFAIDATALKENLMEDALDDYKGGLSMLSYAVHTVMGGATVPNNLTWTLILGSSTYAPQKDLIWQTYKSYYISYKQRVNQFLMDVYGFRHRKLMDYDVPTVSGMEQISAGQFNGAIGAGNVNTGVFPTLQSNAFFGPAYLLVYGTYMFQTPGSGWTVDATPIYFRGPEYDSKQIRITRFDALSDASLSDEAAISELGAQTDYGIWQSTGLCPLTLDMERFLHSQGLSGALSTMTTTAGVGTFSPDLFSALTSLPISSSGPGMTITAGFPGTSLTLEFGLSFPLVSQTFTIPQLDPTLLWSNYGNLPGNWHIYSVSHSFPIPTTNNVKVLIKAGFDPLTAQEYVVTYQSPINLNDCQTAYTGEIGDLDPACKKDEKIEAAILGVMQQLMENLDGSSVPLFYSSSPVDITNYSSYVSSGLGVYLGFPAGTAVYWNQNAGAGTFSLTCGSIVFECSVGSYSSALTSITSFSIVGTTCYFTGLTDDEAEEISDYSGGYTLTNGETPLVLDLSCACGSTEQSPEEAIAAYLNYLIAHPSIPCGSQPAELLAIKDYLPFLNPVIYSYNATTGQIRHAEQGTPCVEGDVSGTCDFLISRPTTILSASNVVITSLGFTFVGQLSGGLTRIFVVRAGCLDVIPCDECEPVVQEPISCSSAHTAYWSAMHTQFSYTDPDELEVFEEEHLADTPTFCASSYAYIYTSYLEYLSEMGITSVTDVRYLSLAEFGNTPLGYSTENLEDALTAYLSYVETHETAEWNSYVTNVYMVANPDLCPVVSPGVSFPEGPFDEAPCNQWEEFCASVNQQNQYELYLAQVSAKFVKDYLAAALSSLVEEFSETHADKEYHYTLYYYDRAGNLIQTVPPQGVERLEVTDTDAKSYSEMNAIRAGEADEFENVDAGDTKKMAPEHTMQTIYRYNSLNQLVYQQTPDGGKSRFAYDRLGRLVLSQNANQKDVTSEPQRFSYTKYDELGRVVEAGELVASSSTDVITDEGVLNDGTDDYTGLTGLNDPIFPENLAASRREVTRSIYDELKDSGLDITVPVNAGSPLVVSSLFENHAVLNTRNRIVGIIYQNDYALSLSTYNNATFYDYDAHGNVKELIQVNLDAALLSDNHHIKHLNYQYDLVSGNVNKVVYQKGQTDQFIHRYAYDDDNRITHAETSKDDFYYEKDAKYFYYDHGPLARTELGDKKVAGSDYAYTIQGWLKAVNGEEIKTATTTMGGDGVSGLNAYAGRDVYGYSLHYFAGDYNASNTSMLNYSSDVASMSDAGSSLYNGNIREMYTVLSDEQEQPLLSHRTSYKYDQLNRITKMDGTYMDLTSGGTITDDESGYKSIYSFDANGNLLTMQNWSSLAKNTPTNSPDLMDDLLYHYLKPDDVGGYYLPGESNNGNIVGTNRLSHVEDPEGSDPLNYGDIDGQDEYNYTYDFIGQLTKDEKEDIDHISWTVTNKVKEVTKSGGDVVIHFDYDALGHRIAKKVMHSDGRYEKTFYVLDGQGNVMSTYERNKVDVSDPALYLADRNMYGSKRVGIEQVHLLMEEVDFSAVPVDMEVQFGQDFNSSETSLGVAWDRQATCPTAVVMSNVGGAMQVTDVCSAQHDLFQPTEIGRQYRFEADFDVSAAEDLYIMFFSHPAGCGTATYAQVLPVSTGHFSYSFTATSTCSRISIRNLGYSDNGGTFTIDNVEFLRGALGTATSSNEVGDKQYELSNHLGNVLNTVTDRKLAGSATDEVIFDDQFSTPGNFLGWSYDPVILAEPLPVDFTATINGSNQLSVYSGTTGGVVGVVKSAYFQAGVSYTLSFDCVTSTAILVGAATNNTTLLLEGVTSPGGHYSYNFTGDGAYGFFGFLEGTNQTMLLDNIKLVANDIQVTTADVKTYSDYYPYGMQLPYRKGAEGETHRYGFQGQEKDDEIKGAGNSLNYEYRMHDPRIGRFFAVDHLHAKRPSHSPYSFVGNSPIINKEIDGNDYELIVNKSDKGNTITIKATVYTDVKGSDSEKAATDATEFWNSQNGKFKYRVNEADGTVTEYDVVFDLTVKPTASAIDAQDKAHSDLQGNSLLVVSEIANGAFGETERLESSFVAKFRKDTDTPEHELGHDLNLGHFPEGVMKEINQAGTITRETIVTKENVQQTIDFALGKVTGHESTAPEGGEMAQTKVDNPKNAKLDGGTVVEVVKPKKK